MIDDDFNYDEFYYFFNKNSAVFVIFNLYFSHTNSLHHYVIQVCSNHILLLNPTST